MKAEPDLLLVVDSRTLPIGSRRGTQQASGSPCDQLCLPERLAWKEYRAKAMLGYVDAVLAVLPFEPAVMQRLGGPETHFVGHRLVEPPGHPTCTTSAPRDGARDPLGSKRTILLLPGSRGGEIAQLLPIFGQAMQEFVTRNGETRFICHCGPPGSACARDDARLAHKAGNRRRRRGKMAGFDEADAAIAASGTVILELALAYVPVAVDLQG